MKVNVSAPVGRIVTVEMDEKDAHALYLLLNQTVDMPEGLRTLFIKLEESHLTDSGYEISHDRAYDGAIKFIKGDW